MANSFQRILDLIESEIKKQPIEGRTPNLYDPVNYIMGLGGKRIRPVLAVMGNNLFGGEISKVIPIAMALEVFHNFTLVHDDIMDNASLRRGKQTVHAKWNLATGILSGDVMLIKAYQLLMQAKPQQLDALLKVFNQTAIEVCEGQQMDMDFESIDMVEEDQYLEMIRLKTSVLLGCSLQMGAITANASAIDMAKLYHFGVNVGMGFQLMDDYLDAFGASELVGKKTGGDILAGKKTVMVIYTMKSESEALRALFTKKEIDDNTKVEEVKNLFVKTGADVYLKTLSDQYFKTAMGYLDSIKTDESSKKPLRELAIGLMDRKF